MADERILAGKERFPAQQGKSAIADDPAILAMAPFPKVWRLLSTDRSWEQAVPWSVTLDVEGSAADNTCDTPGAIANVRWGVGGVRHHAYVDWRKGTRFVVVGATLDLDLWMLNPTDWQIPDMNADGIPDVTGWPATFRASAVPGPITQLPDGAGPTLTVAVPNVEAQGFSGFVTVPPFARWCEVTGQDSGFAVPVFAVDWWNGAPGAPLLPLRRDAILASANRNVPQNLQRLPVPSDATQVRVQSFGPGARLDYIRFCFGLAM